MTRTPEEQLLSDLGLPAETQLTEVARAPLPPAVVAHGLSGPLPAARDYSESFEDLPLSSVTGPLPFLLTRSALEHALVRIEDAPAPSALHGAAESTPEGVRLDGRAGRESACLLETAEGLYLVHLGPTGVIVSSCTVSPAPPEPWTPVSVELDVPPPTLSELLDGAPAEPWLSERATRLAASPAMVEQASAVGLVARLWEPDRSLRKAILDGTRPHPSDHATRWLRSLGESRKVLEELALHRAAGLREAFAILPEGDDDPSDDDVLSLFYERDILESVRVLLAFVGEGRALGRELVLTDDVAFTAFSAIAPSDRLRNDPLLRAVFLSEPDAFWGQFVET